MTKPERPIEHPAAGQPHFFAEAGLPFDKPNSDGGQFLELAVTGGSGFGRAVTVSDSRPVFPEIKVIVLNFHYLRISVAGRLPQAAVISVAGGRDFGKLGAFVPQKTSEANLVLPLPPFLFLRRAGPNTAAVQKPRPSVLKANPSGPARFNYSAGEVLRC